jgi:hypothetical protein
MKEKIIRKPLKSIKMPQCNKPDEEQGIITHWQKKMLKENPPKEDKKDKDKGQRQKRSGQERQR